jgi:hypothetical protein
MLLVPTVFDGEPIAVAALTVPSHRNQELP